MKRLKFLPQKEAIASDWLDLFVYLIVIWQRKTYGLKSKNRA